MTILYPAMREISSPAIPREFRVLILFCLLGLTISAAALPWLDADTADFIINHAQ